MAEKRGERKEAESWGGGGGGAYAKSDEKFVEIDHATAVLVHAFEDG